MSETRCQRRIRSNFALVITTWLKPVNWTSAQRAGSDRRIFPASNCVIRSLCRAIALAEYFSLDHGSVRKSRRYILIPVSFAIVFLFLDLSAKLQAKFIFVASDEPAIVRRSLDTKYCVACGKDLAGMCSRWINIRSPVSAVIATLDEWYCFRRSWFTKYILCVP